MSHKRIIVGSVKNVGTMKQSVLFLIFFFIYFIIH